MIALRSYLDHNATSPLRPEAREAMLAAFDCIGNPSSVHTEGRAARAILEKARETTASIFDVKPSQVYFTSGGTEAANWLLKPAAPRQKLAVAPVEHPCVLRGHSFGEILEFPVGSDGLADLDLLDKRLAADAKETPAVVAVQAANNETGVVQPLADIAKIAKARGAAIVCDAVQVIGRLDEQELHAADAFFLSAHKFGGPKGVGAVVIRRETVALEPLIKGGGQERRRRSGTENVAGIAGLAAALQAAVSERLVFAGGAEAMREKVEAGLRSIAPDAVIFGEKAPRLPNTTCFAIPGLRAEMLLIAFDLDGAAVSSGSACSSGKVERSHVLKAMGVSDELSSGAIRVSTGWNTKDMDIQRFLAVLTKICASAGHRNTGSNVIAKGVSPEAIHKSGWMASSRTH
jgi:cysteine desulfurase